MSSAHRLHLSLSFYGKFRISYLFPHQKDMKDAPKVGTLFWMAYLGRR